MNKGIGKKWLFPVLVGCFMSICGYANEPIEAVSTNDSTEVLLENGLKSLIDTTAITSPQGMEEIVDIMPDKQISHTADSSDWDEEVYRTYGIYNRLIMPFEYDRPYFCDVWKIKPYTYSFEAEKKWMDIPTEKINPELEEYFQIDSVRQSIFHNLIFKNPLWVTGLKKDLPAEYEFDEFKPVVEEHFLIERLTRSDIDIRNMKASDKIYVNPGKQSYWTYANKSSLQFSQNYISSNWQAGGESNLALNGNLNMKANYTHAKGITLNNELEWRASFFTAPSDTVRSWRITDDIFRLTSNFAVKAFHKWNYSSTAEFKTRFFNSFKVNSNTKLASFLSPAEFSFSIGMSYANEFKKLKIKDLNLALSPISYNWKWVMQNKRVDVTRYGISAGQTSLSQVGSRLDLKFMYEMKKNIYWNTRFYYFTTYKSVESEWENTVNFAINRYFSTKIFFHLKYDDKRNLKSDEDSYFQFKELLSFGFNYVW